MASVRERSAGICHPHDSTYYGAKDNPIGYYCRKCDKLFVYSDEEVPLAYEYDLAIFREGGWDEDVPDDIELVWGIISYDDLSSQSEATLYTMNDIELVRHKDTGEFSLSVETAYEFDDPKPYLQGLLDAFTKWMVENGYDTNHKFHPYWHFSGGYNIDTHFKTVEEVYANFRLLVRGYCESH